MKHNILPLSGSNMKPFLLLDPYEEEIWVLADCYLKTMCYLTQISFSWPKMLPLHSLYFYCGSSTGSWLGSFFLKNQQISLKHYPPEGDATQNIQMQWKGCEATTGYQMEVWLEQSKALGYFYAHSITHVTIRLLRLQLLNNTD